MKIPYKKERDIINLIGSILFGICAVYEFTKDSPNDIYYLTLFCSISFFLYFIFNKKIYFLNIKNGIIKKGLIFKKEIHLTDVNRIIILDKKYILKTISGSELEIDTKIVESKSLNKLIAILKKLDVEWTEKNVC